MDAPTPNPSILDLVVAGLDDGTLWVLENSPVWTGHGILKPCVVCRVKIDNHEIQHDVVGPRGSLPVHAKCYRAWRAQSDKLRKNA